MTADKRNLTEQPSASLQSSDEEVSTFLAEVRARPAAETGGRRGRLIFAMDATMSRQPSWDRALGLQAQMFNETAKIGGLDVQLIYFRGFGECRASKWVSDPKALSGLMTQVACRGGLTQIRKILKHIRRETERERVNAAVYVGDCVEEDVDALCQQAGEIGMLGVPLFMFQDGYEPTAEIAFREIARLSRGAYCRFDSASARQLRELLSAVAVYAAGGRKALADYSRATGGGATALLEQLK